MKLLRFDCNFFSILSGNRNQRFLKNCLLRCGLRQNVYDFLTSALSHIYPYYKLMQVTVAHINATTRTLLMTSSAEPRRFANTHTAPATVSFLCQVSVETSANFG